MSSSRKSSHQELAESIGKNTVFGVVARVAQVATRLVTIPIVIAHLGLGGYGIWSILMTTAAYMRFGSIGVKSAFQKYVAEAVARQEYRLTNQLLSTGCACMLALSVLGLVPVAVFSRQIAVLSGVPAPFLASSSKAITVLALIMVLSNVGSVYEAIVMGGHRIDLARKLTTMFCIAEAVAIACLLHWGYGLFAMASVMAASELGFIACCYVASRRIVPGIEVSRGFVTRSVMRELARFAGSYQLRGALEVVYLAILPITVLRAFGAEAAGIYALASRLASTATTAPDAFLLPILSGGTAIYTAGSPAAMQALIVKSFKVTLALALLPLAFMAVFGSDIVYAWTGQASNAFGPALWLVCLAALWQAFSILGIVLYRVSGNVLLDNVQQCLRIVTLLLVAAYSHALGFVGMLAGLAGVELIGTAFMLVALEKTFAGFRAAALLADALRIGLATAVIIGVGWLAIRVPVPLPLAARTSAVLALGFALAGCLLSAWPMYWLTKSFTSSELRTLFRAVGIRRRDACPAVATS